MIKLFFGLFLAVFLFGFNLGEYKNNRFWKTIKTKKFYKMGKRLYHDRCERDEVKDYIDLYLDVKDLKNDLKQKYCKNLDEQRASLVALYLWDRVRVDDNITTIEVTHDEKCPICGMFVYKYPRWAAQIWYKNATHKSFDGVKDLTKYRDKFGLKDVDKILVTDYYTQEAIDGEKAFYVVGSDVYGPMGDEAIPFKTKEDAKNFLKDHRGDKILKFEEVKFDFKD